ncbi:hypothetical protein [Microtetraspora malaysiensis]|uniref:hypothetical protein n=1 Tax=Microtetraspora malaysiensis TaxID=161358 RepID=UPI003D90BC6E
MLFVVSICVIALTACVPTLGDPPVRPVGIGRSGDGQLRFVVALCPGEQLASFEVTDHSNEQLIWKVSQPIGAMRQGGEVVLGDSSGFATVVMKLSPSVPENIDATARLTDDFTFGSAFLRNEIPQDLAGTDYVLNRNKQKVGEQKFVRQVRNDYCRSR